MLGLPLVEHLMQHQQQQKVHPEGTWHQQHPGPGSSSSSSSSSRAAQQQRRRPLVCWQQRVAWAGGASSTWSSAASPQQKQTWPSLNSMCFLRLLQVPAPSTLLRSLLGALHKGRQLVSGNQQNALAHPCVLANCNVGIATYKRVLCVGC
jgi:hypothetical protein